MKRPLAVTGLAMLLFSVILCPFADTSVAILTAVISYSLFMISVVIPKLRKGYILPTVLLALFISSVMFYAVQCDYEKLSALEGNDADIVCEVKEEPVFNEKYGRYYCKAEVSTIDGVKYTGNIRLSFNGTYNNIDPAKMKIGNTLAFSGYLYKAGGQEREIINYFKSEKIYSGVYSIKNLTVRENEIKPVGYYGNELRKFISQSFRESFSPDTAGLLTALLTGDKAYVSDEVYDSFKNSGVAHLMAVSGMHLAVLVMFLDLFIKKLRRRHKKLRYIILVFFIFFFMFMASFSPSVVRAGAMMLILLTGQLIDKRADSLNSLGFACICILAANPFSAMSAGFLLSVLSTLAIITAAVPFCNRHRYFICDKLRLYGRFSFAAGRLVMLSLSISICVMVYTLPAMAVFFGGISLISPVANLLFLPVNTIIIVLAFISAILCAVDLMPSPLVFFIEKISAYCLGVAEVLGGTDRFILEIKTPLAVAASFLVPFVLYLAIIAGKKLYKKYKAKKRKPL